MYYLCTCPLHIVVWQGARIPIICFYFKEAHLLLDDVALRVYVHSVHTHVCTLMLLADVALCMNVHSVHTSVHCHYFIVTKVLVLPSISGGLVQQFNGNCLVS